MMKKWKKALAAVCTVSMLTTMPGLSVLADEMQEEELIVADAVVPEETVESLVEDDIDRIDAWIEENNVNRNTVEEIVGIDWASLGGDVEGAFYEGTGAVKLISHSDGEPVDHWISLLYCPNREAVKSIEVVLGTVFLPADSEYMFEGLVNLTDIDLSGFNTSRVSEMVGMFRGCSSLTSIDLSSFDTSNVLDMHEMFCDCTSLQSLDLSSFDTSNVGDGMGSMGHMFSNCSSLTSIDLSSFDTSKVEDMRYMFEGCSRLTSLDLSSFDVSNVTEMGCMFYRCYNLQLICTPKNNSQPVDLPIRMYDSSGKSYTHLPNTTESIVLAKTQQMAQEYEKLKDISLAVDEDVIGPGDIELGGGVTATFDEKTGAVGLYSDNGYLANDWFSADRKSVKSIKVIIGTVFLDFEAWSVFEGLDNLTDLDLSDFDTSRTVRMASLFRGCKSLKSIDLSSFDTSNVGDMSVMFGDCTSLQSLDLSSFDTSNVGSMGHMFSNCSSLTSIDLSSFDTSKVEDMRYMFEGCSSLTSLDLSSFDVSNATVMGGMFYDCYNLQLICTPKNNSQPVDLPIKMYDSAGNSYTHLPNTTESIVLAKTQQMAQEYEGQISDDTNYCSISNGPFFFRSGLKNDDSIEYSFDYDDNWLFSNSLDDSYKLMKTSIRVAMAAFGTKTDNDYGAENIKKMMDTMHFTYSDASIKYEKPENDSIGSAIGMKNIKKQDGSTASIILVVLRGGGYGAEWGGNFRVGAPNIKDHEGFRQAANIVDARLEEFYKTNRDIINRSNDVRIWVTGYSRAAATANLVAADLIDGKCDIEINPEKVIAFCFECPRNTRRVGIALSKYNNIINVVNPIDFVPKLALRGWGFTRYGTTYYIPSKETTAKYEKKYKNEMRSKYKALCDNNSISFKKSFVHEAFGQGSILDAYVDFLATYIRRDEYWSTYQETFMSIGRSKLGGSGTPDWGAAAPELIKILGITSLQPVKTAEVVSMFLKGNTGPGPSAHYHELCMSWIDSLGSFSNFQTSDNSWYRKFLVNCPVEVIVTDRSGSIVGHIVNDTVEEIEDGIAVRIDGDGQKVFILPPDDEYDVKVIAEEDATINYSIEEYNIDSNAIEKVINYKKIDATQGEAIVGTASIGNSIDDAEYTLKYAEKEEMIVPDEVKTGDDIEMFAVEVSCAGQGSVTGGGVYTNGEFAQVTAVPDDGFEFIGWFVENELVSKEEKYRFGVEKNILLEARFSNSSSEIEPTPIPTITPIPTPTTIPNAPGARFSDVQDPSHPYYKAIYWAAEKKITGGYKDGTFGINKPCTRGHAVMFLWKMEGAPAPKDAEKTPFPDVPKTHPYYKAVLWAQQKGITKGYTSGPNKGKFGIDDTCTRGQIMTFIWNYKGKPTPKAESKSPFSDVPTTHPYYKAILWGSKNGVTKGYTSGPNAGKFGINDSCTRGQIVKFLYNIR